MNTILITARVTPLTTQGEVVLRPMGGSLAARRAATDFHRRETRALPTDGRNAARPASRYTHAMLARGSWGERGLYLVLAAAAFAGVVLAVLTVLEQAQNWPLFNAWVGRVLGA